MTEHTEVRALARKLWERWRQSLRPDVRAFLGRADALPSAGIAAVLRVDQRERWIGGERVLAHSYLRDFPRLNEDPEAVLELIYGEILIREELGESPDLEEYARSYPDHAERLRIQLELHRAMHEQADECPSDDESTWEDVAPSVVSARGPR